METGPAGPVSVSRRQRVEVRSVPRRAGRRSLACASGSTRHGSGFPRQHGVGAGKTSVLRGRVPGRCSIPRSRSPPTMANRWFDQDDGESAGRSGCRSCGARGDACRRGAVRHRRIAESTMRAVARSRIDHDPIKTGRATAHDGHGDQTIRFRRRSYVEARPLARARCKSMSGLIDRTGTSASFAQERSRRLLRNRFEIASTMMTGST